MGDVDEGHLLRQIARGDRGAFDEFYRRTAPWLAVRLRRRCADDDIVAEVLQESYLAVWQAAASYLGSSDSSAGGGSAGGWLWTIASRRLVDAFRRRARQQEALIAEPVRSEPTAEDEVLLAIPEDTALTAALAELSPELHTVLRLMVLDGLTARETAGLLGVPEATVRTRARRARLHLRRALS